MIEAERAQHAEWIEDYNQRQQELSQPLAARGVPQRLAGA